MTDAVDVLWRFRRSSMVGSLIRTGLDRAAAGREKSRCPQTGAIAATTVAIVMAIRLNMAAANQVRGPPPRSA
eukprot:TRINITY_DN8416_c0_g1_i1.p4 TRINITY_DN8416_c0_g1~~TRINITY_DN8416_c0_g1_i1.p4  ORF type:complete len:73 (-),score=6.87 TRINITY_DN8416_c0_g1_i1:187-405(-)